MWAIIKFDKNKLSTLKREFFDKIGNDVKFYIPKLKIKKFIKSKVSITESFLLGDYLLCFHKDFSNSMLLSSLKYSKGLKYFLNDFLASQKEIENFILKCRENEDKEGFIKQTFFEYRGNSKFEFVSGPFTNMIFSILDENKLSIKALIGKYKISVSKEQNLFRPV